ncbi:PREDICTED: zinc finger protein 598 [Dinoponera quadriceps]|uniref:RING-type E3 ubiquitin transferase n=1 Tax=Dinoponera quadriceps TaxID=609295 RepID=A0A6P3Y3Z1_DINQU|nr:PREDICTED: zinc finger protein 598 [Dinoponera quadriceps]XP_014485602.1 PREDICTED: zinc finger protein 598 [Dinoponera quadriceps]
MSGTNDSFNSNTCVVCYKNVEIYSIGMCEHPVCYECSTRMRVLCRQNECPICRQDLPKVVFTREIKPFRYLCKGNLIDDQYAIYFGSPDIQEKFNDLLANTCSMCKEKQVFGSFNSLKDHMRHQHELHYCDLCVENLKIFSHERRCYTRASLAQHRRKGDLDDKSHKGHPLCEFCDQRYMDNDELYRHLRRDHLYCHFCDADGLHQYYSSYDYLREHFRQEHYLCEEGVCAEEKFTSVFRTDIDLKAHKASVHGKQLSKAAAKQARTLELEFTLAPRGDNRINRRGMLSASTSRNTREHCNNSRDYQQQQPSSSFDPPFFVRQPSVDVQSTDEFPTLGNAAPVVVPTLTQSKGRGNVTIRSTVRNQPLAVTDENFPALGPDSAGISKTVNFSVTSNAAGMAQCQKASSNVSIQVNHEANGTVTTRVSGPNIRIRPAQLSIDSEFPALGNSEPSTSTANSTQWKEVLQWTCSKSAPTSASKKVPPLSSSPIREDFPSLSKSSKSKKQSVITVVPTWGQNASTNNNAKTTTDLTKGRTKKKKVKQQTSNGNSSSGNESNSSNANASKRDAEQTRESKESSNACKTTEHASRKDKKKNKNNVAEPGGGDTNGVQRKRSELKIDSLNTTNNNIHKVEDFPALGSSSSRLSNPPPGFGSPVPPPPPGFSVKYNSLDRLHGSNGLTFTSSSGESYSILPPADDAGHAYASPPDFQRRNTCLVARLNEVLLHQDKIDQFRYVSGLFRGGTCDAEEYYTHCREVMGSHAFENVFPELLVLLPDIAKQQELFKVHKRELAGKAKGLEVCATCGQVAKNGADFRAHMSSHTLENHFPALGKSSTPPLKNTWVRK